MPRSRTAQYGRNKAASWRDGGNTAVCMNCHPAPRMQLDTASRTLVRTQPTVQLSLTAAFSRYHIVRSGRVEARRAGDWLSIAARKIEQKKNTRKIKQKRMEKKNRIGWKKKTEANRTPLWMVSFATALPAAQGQKRKDTPYSPCLFFKRLERRRRNTVAITMERSAPVGKTNEYI
jgi:hypothetical protein